MADDVGGQSPKQKISPTVECQGKQGPGAPVFTVQESPAYRFSLPLGLLLRRLLTGVQLLQALHRLLRLFGEWSVGKNLQVAFVIVASRTRLAKFFQTLA
jgi:hypothetical protein